MTYSIQAYSKKNEDGTLRIKESDFCFGISDKSAKTLANPAELFLGSLSACILKNVERFSVLLKFEYSSAEIKVNANRLEKPPRMDEIDYQLKIISNDSSLNIELLKKNLERYGTIYNTIGSVCSINGSITVSQN